MKIIQKNILVALASLAIVACSGGDLKIDYLPCVVDKNEDWGFVDNKGEVILNDYFKYEPTAVVEGVFSVWENGAYNLYKIDPKKPQLLVEGLAEVGYPVGGILPVCRKKSKIEVVDTKGKTVFELDKIKGDPVVWCLASFNKYGYLQIAIKDKDNDRKYGLVDRKGQVVISPKYNEMEVVGPDLIAVLDEDDNAAYINLKGEKRKTFKAEDRFVTSNDSYICLRNSDYVYKIYDQKTGDLVLKCSDKVNNVKRLSDKTFIFKGEDGYGVMDYKGSLVIKAMYAELDCCGSVFIAKKDSKHSYEVLDGKGETVGKISFKEAGVFSNFVLAGDNDHEIFLLDGKFEATTKNGVYKMGLNLSADGSSYIKSQYVYSSPQKSNYEEEFSYKDVAVDCEYDTTTKCMGGAVTAQDPSNYVSDGLNIYNSYPITSTRKLVYSDVSGISKADLRIIRNEIFARHGYIFKSADLSEFFSAYDWYEPIYTNVATMLSPVENYNVTFLKGIEDSL